MIPIWLQNFARGRTVAIVLLLWLGIGGVLFTVGPYPSLRSAGGGDLLEETFGYSAADAREYLQALGEDGRNTHRTFQLLDGLNAAMTTVALTLSLAFTLCRLLGPRNALRLLVYLPVLAGACELLENWLLLALHSAFPSETSTARLAGPITSTKLVLGFSALSITVLSFLALGVKALRDRSKPK